MSSSSSPDQSSSLLHFLRLFNSNLLAAHFSYAPSHPSSLSELSDGLYLYRLLHTLEPAHFDLDGLEPAAGTIDASADNVQHLLVSLETYMEDASGIGKAVDLSALVDVERMSDVDVLRLVQVSLLCCVNSAQRAAVIGKVMELGEREQEQLMVAINEIMGQLHLTATPGVGNTPGRLSDVSVDSSGSSGEARSPSSALRSSFLLPSPSGASTPKATTLSAAAAASSPDEQVVALERELRELKRVNAEQAEELRALRSEKELAHSRGVQEGQQLREKEWADRLVQEQQKRSREHAEMQHRLTELSAALHQQQRAQLAVDKEKARLLASLDELQHKQRQLEDGLQVAQAKADQAGQLEAKVSRLSALVSSVGDLKAQAEYCEEEARRSVERIVQLEREVREMAALKAAISRLKEALGRKEEEALEGKLREDELKAELDDARLQLRERDRQIKEAEDEARRLQEALKARERSEKEATGPAAVGDFEVIGAPPPGPSLRQKLRRLEAENEELRARCAQQQHPQGGGGGEAAGGVQLAVYTESEMDVARSKYLEAMRKVQQLERAARQLARPLFSPSAPSSTERDSEVAELQQQLEEAQAQLLRLELPSSSSSSSSALPSGPVTKLRKYHELWKQASKRVAAYRAREDERLKEAAAMKEQLARQRQVIGEREREVEVREKVRVEEMAVSLRERRIVQAAFYNLGVDYASAGLLGKGGGGGGGGMPRGHERQLAGARAWLARQRAAAGE